MDFLLFKVINVSVIIIHMAIFGILGYKKAMQRNLNPRLWATLCAILGVWAYLYLIFYKDKP